MEESGSVLVGGVSSDESDEDQHGHENVDDDMQAEQTQCKRSFAFHGLTYQRACE